MLKPAILLCFTRSSSKRNLPAALVRLSLDARRPLCFPQAPWSQFKKGDAEKAQAALDLLAILEASRILAITLSPIAPRVTQRIYLQLGYSEGDWKAVTWVSVSAYSFRRLSAFFFSLCVRKSEDPKAMYTRFYLLRMLRTRF